MFCYYFTKMTPKMEIFFSECIFILMASRTLHKLNLFLYALFNANRPVNSHLVSTWCRCVCARNMRLVDECSRCDAIFQRQLEFVSPICQENEQKLSLIRYAWPPVTLLSIWVILIAIKGLCTLSQCFADGASKVVDV